MERRKIKMDEENNIPEEELENIIILNDENGEEVPFEFLDLIELNGEEYVVLLPVEEEEEDSDEVVILKIEDTENEEEESYVSVDDEETLNRVFAIFKDKFKDEFNFIEDEEVRKDARVEPSRRQGGKGIPWFRVQVEDILGLQGPAEGAFTRLITT